MDQNRRWVEAKVLIDFLWSELGYSRSRICRIRQISTTAHDNIVLGYATPKPSTLDQVRTKLVRHLVEINVSLKVLEDKYGFDLGRD